MTRDVLEVAKKHLSARKFRNVILLLESRREIYEKSYEYYILLGTASLYLGDIGSATSYYQKARNISLTGTDLLLGQAAIFLRKGDTPRALHYYTEVLSNAPENPVARRALAFIRRHGDYETICRYVDTGRIEFFYPAIGTSYRVKIMFFILFILALLLIILPFTCKNFTLPKISFQKMRNKTSRFEKIATKNAEARKKADEGRSDAEDNKKAEEKDSTDRKNEFHSDDTEVESYEESSSSNQKEAAKTYERALKFFENYRDNLAQIEVNRLLLSDASSSYKKKARLLASYIEEPNFATVKDAPTLQSITENPALYDGCYVVWGGRVTNVVRSDTSLECDFLVGYEDMKKVDALVKLKFNFAAEIDAERPLKVLSKIVADGKTFTLNGRAIFQSVHGALENEGELKGE